MGIDNANIVIYYENTLLILSVKIGETKLQLQRISSGEFSTYPKSSSSDWRMLNSRISSSLKSNSNTLYQDGRSGSLDRNFFSQIFSPILILAYFPPAVRPVPILATSRWISHKK